MAIVPWRALSLAALSISMSTASIPQDVRSVALLSRPHVEAPSKYDPAQSAALFVGVQKSAAGIEEVPYAVDDAINLAYAFSLDRKIALVRPERIVLALSGEPKKKQSQEQLARLRAAGATITMASKSEVLARLRQQAASAGREGLLIVAFAGHGFSEHGMPYVMSETSVYGNASTSISTAEAFDIASTAGRSLMFIDACRERMPGAVRSGNRDLRGAAPSLRNMSRINGQVVFYAAAAGKFAYDDHEKQNGVFTNAILESLRCDVARDARGTVTVETLVAYVEKRVLEWIRKHRDPSAHAATQISLDGGTKKMPLASCPAPVSLMRAVRRGTSVVAFGDDGSELWRRTIDGPITHTEAVDLDGDGMNEAVVAVDTRIEVFDTAGDRIWIADTNAPRNYGRHPGCLTVRKFIIGAFRGKTRLLVTLSVDGQESESRLEIIDHDNDARRDISIATSTGSIHLTFDGQVLKADGVQFVTIAR